MNGKVEYIDGTDRMTAVLVDGCQVAIIGTGSVNDPRRTAVRDVDANVAESLTPDALSSRLSNPYRVGASTTDGGRILTERERHGEWLS